MVARMQVFFQKCRPYLILILLVVMLQALNLFMNRDEIRAKSPSFDYDGYWHLLRVQEIHRTGNWDNHINARGNAPFGERLHWTHAMDLVLWTGATIGSLFLDFDSSLYWWGVVVGPLFYVLSLLALIWLGRALLEPKYARLPALLFLCNFPQLFAVYSINRPDHHCLVAFAYVLCYGRFLVLLENPESTAAAVWAGLLGAFGLWCGLEVLVLVGLSALYLSLLWLLRGEKYLKANGLFALALSVGLLIAVLLEGRPGHYLDITYDKASIVHAGLFCLVFVFWLSEGLLVRTGLGEAIRSRLPIAGGGVVAVFLAGWALFPQFLHGPMAQVDPRLCSLYLGRTGEFGTMTISNLPHVGYNVLLVGPALLYLAWGAYRNHDARRTMFAWLAVTMCAYFVLALTMGRWLHTFAFTCILPTALVLTALWKWQSTRRRPLAAFAATIALVCAPYLALAFPHSSEKASGGAAKRYKSKVVTMLSFMKSQDYMAPGAIVLANTDIGPALMYYTAFDAVGTPNHNNDQGILDTYGILNAGNDGVAHELIEARGIDYLLIDERLQRFAAYRIDSAHESRGSSGDATFVGRLSLGRIPDWLVKMPVPEGLADTFMLYRVRSEDVGTRRP